jgi:hypothetical protein
MFCMIRKRSTTYHTLAVSLSSAYLLNMAGRGIAVLHSLVSFLFYIHVECDWQPG